MKTYEEINQKIKNKDAVVVTAEEMIDIVEKNGPEKAAEEVLSLPVHPGLTPEDLETIVNVLMEASESFLIKFR